MSRAPNAMKDQRRGAATTFRMKNLKTTNTSLLLDPAMPTDDRMRALLSRLHGCQDDLSLIMDGVPDETPHGGHDDDDDEGDDNEGSKVRMLALLAGDNTGLARKVKPKRSPSAQERWHLLNAITKKHRPLPANEEIHESFNSNRPDIEKILGEEDTPQPEEETMFGMASGVYAELPLSRFSEVPTPKATSAGAALGSSTSLLIPHATTPSNLHSKGMGTSLRLSSHGKGHTRTLSESSSGSAGYGGMASSMSLASMDEGTMVSLGFVRQRELKLKHEAQREYGAMLDDAVRAGREEGYAAGFAACEAAQVNASQPLRAQIEQLQLKNKRKHAEAMHKHLEAFQQGDKINRVRDVNETLKILVSKFGDVDIERLIADNAIYLEEREYLFKRAFHSTNNFDQPLEDGMQSQKSKRVAKAEKQKGMMERYGLEPGGGVARAEVYAQLQGCQRKVIASTRSLGLAVDALNEVWAMNAAMENRALEKHDAYLNPPPKRKINPNVIATALLRKQQSAPDHQMQPQHSLSSSPLLSQSLTCSPKNVAVAGRDRSGDSSSPTGVSDADDGTTSPLKRRLSESRRSSVRIMGSARDAVQARQLLVTAAADATAGVATTSGSHSRLRGRRGSLGKKGAPPPAPSGTAVRSGVSRPGPMVRRSSTTLLKGDGSDSTLLVPLPSPSSCTGPSAGQVDDEGASTSSSTHHNIAAVEERWGKLLNLIIQMSGADHSGVPAEVAAELQRWVGWKELAELVQHHSRDLRHLREITARRKSADDESSDDGEKTAGINSKTGLKRRRAPKPAPVLTRTSSTLKTAAAAVSLDGVVSEGSPTQPSPMGKGRRTSNGLPKGHLGSDASGGGAGSKSASGEGPFADIDLEQTVSTLDGTMRTVEGVSHASPLQPSGTRMFVESHDGEDGASSSSSSFHAVKGAEKNTAAFGGAAGEMSQEEFDAATKTHPTLTATLESRRLREVESLQRDLKAAEESAASLRQQLSRAEGEREAQLATSAVKSDKKGPSQPQEQLEAALRAILNGCDAVTARTAMLHEDVARMCSAFRGMLDVPGAVVEKTLAAKPRKKQYADGAIQNMVHLAFATPTSSHSASIVATTGFVHEGDLRTFELGAQALDVAVKLEHTLQQADGDGKLLNDHVKLSLRYPPTSSTAQQQGKRLEGATVSTPTSKGQGSQSALRSSRQDPTQQSKKKLLPAGATTPTSKTSAAAVPRKAALPSSPKPVAQQVKGFLQAMAAKDGVDGSDDDSDSSSVSSLDFDDEIVTSTTAVTTGHASSAGAREAPLEPPSAGIKPLGLVLLDLANSAEIARSSSSDALPAATAKAALRQYRAVVASTARKYSGYVSKKIDDSAFFIVFANPLSAVGFSIALHKALLDEKWDPQLCALFPAAKGDGAVTSTDDTSCWGLMQLRVGCHVGSPVMEVDVLTQRAEYFGPSVAAAADIHATAAGGQCVVSDELLQLLLQEGQVLPTSRGDAPLLIQPSRLSGEGGDKDVETPLTVSFHRAPSGSDADANQVLYSVLPQSLAARQTVFDTTTATATPTSGCEQPLKSMLLNGPTSMMPHDEVRDDDVYATFDPSAADPDEPVTMVVILVDRPHALPTRSWRHGTAILYDLIKSQVVEAGAYPAKNNHCNVFHYVFRDTDAALRLVLALQRAAMNLPWDVDTIACTEGRDASATTLLYRGLPMKIGVHRCKPEAVYDGLIKRTRFLSPEAPIAASLALNARRGEVLVSDSVKEKLMGRWDEVGSPSVDALPFRIVVARIGSLPATVLLPEGLHARLATRAEFSVQPLLSAQEAAAAAAGAGDDVDSLASDASEIITAGAPHCCAACRQPTPSLCLQCINLQCETCGNPFPVPTECSACVEARHTRRSVASMLGNRSPDGSFSSLAVSPTAAGGGAKTSPSARSSKGRLKTATGTSSATPSTTTLLTPHTTPLLPSINLGAMGSSPSKKQQPGPITSSSPISGAHSPPGGGGRQPLPGLQGTGRSPRGQLLASPRGGGGPQSPKQTGLGGGGHTPSSSSLVSDRINANQTRMDLGGAAFGVGAPPLAAAGSPSPSSSPHNNSAVLLNKNRIICHRSERSYCQ